MTDDIDDDNSTNIQSLIRQAIRELHIDIPPYDRAYEIQASPDGEAVTVVFKNRSGDEVDVELSTEAGYKGAYEEIRKAWYK